MPLSSNALREDDRRWPRDEVYHRARGFDMRARELQLLIVNISPMGLMARCDAAIQAEERIRVNLPIVGTVAATVRWSLGGRLGCQFDQQVDQASYYEMLANLLKN